MPAKLTMTGRNLRRKCNIVPIICGGLRYVRKILYLICARILNVIRDYNEIYLSIFSVFHEIMLRAKWTSRNDDRISTFRGPFKVGRTVPGRAEVMQRYQLVQFCPYWYG